MKKLFLIFALQASLFAAEEKPTVQVFMSFSVPIATWKHYALEAKGINALFILRGIPDNSFPAFAVKMDEFRKEGIDLSIDIDPDLFEQYGIEAVPTIVLKREDGYDKIAGNLRLEDACRIMGGK